MGRVEITRIVQFSSRDVATVNANYAAIQAQSTSLDSTNFREEGIDREALHNEAFSEQWFTPVTNTGPTAYTGTGVYETLGLSSAFSVASGLGAFSASSYDMYLRFMCQLRTTPGTTNWGVPVGRSIEFQFRTVTGAGTTDDTTAQVFYRAGAQHTWTSPSVSGPAGYDTCVCMGLWIPGGTYTQVAVRVKGENTIDYYFGGALFLGKAYSK